MLNDVFDVGDGNKIDTSKRLIEQDDFRFGCKGESDLYTPTLTTGEGNTETLVYVLNVASYAQRISLLRTMLLA